MKDFNDLHQEQGPEAVAIAISNAEKPEPDATDGIKVTALARDPSGYGWSKVVTFTDADGKERNELIPNTALAGEGTEAIRVLLDSGAPMPAGRSEQGNVLRAMLSANPTTRALLVNKAGWNGGAYVNQDGKVYGEAEEKIILQAAAEENLQVSGTLESWQNNVAKYAVGNSRLAFAISAAFTGPLLAIAGEDSGGFHFSGESSGGKTTALRVASSVWGSQYRTWRTTDNAAESWCKQANDGLLLLDEMSQVDGKAAEAMAYMVGNGQGKGRASRTGQARTVSKWRLLFLSTGEIGLADKIAEGGKKAKAGQAVRVLEIPADAGAGMRMLENLHEFDEAFKLAVHLNQASQEHKGIAADCFLSELSGIEWVKLREALEISRSDWLTKYLPSDADGQVKRAAARFALVAAAGGLAQSMGLLPWPENEAGKAVGRCFNDWLRSRGGNQSFEVTEGIKEILDFIDENGNSRFQCIDDTSNLTTIRNRVGFRQNEGETCYYWTFPKAYKREILGGSKGEKSVTQAAIEKGLILPGKDGRPTQSKYISGVGQKRLYCIAPSLYQGDDNA